MRDDDIRDDLLNLAGPDQVSTDLDAIYSAGIQKRRRRQVGLISGALAVVVGLGFAASTLISTPSEVVDVSVADGSSVSAPQTTEAPGDTSSTTSAPPATQATPSTTSTTTTSADEDAITSASDDDDPSTGSDEPSSDEDTTIEEETTAEDNQTTDDDATAEDDVAGNTQPTKPSEDFACEAFENGMVRWTDTQQSEYWVYRSVDNGATYEWLSRSDGETVFFDEEVRPGYLYQLRYKARPSENCTVNSDFACLTTTSGTVTWTSHDASSVIISRSVDSGSTFDQIAKIESGPAFTDPDYDPKARYRVTYPGLTTPADCIERPGSACQVSSSGRVSWTDDEQTLYWIYRSTDEGATYAFVGKTTGETWLIDDEYKPGDRYQVDHRDLWPRAECIQSQ